MRENENEKAILDGEEKVTSEVEVVTDEADATEEEELEEIELDDFTDVSEIEEPSEEEDEPEVQKDNTWITMVVVGIIALTIAIIAACLFTSEARTKQLNTLLSKVSSLEEQVAMLQEAEDKDIVKTYKGVVKGVSSVTEKGKTKYYVEISSAGKFEVSQSIYEEIEDFVGCVVNWYEHTTFDEEGAKIIWYNYDIESVG